MGTLTRFALEDFLDAYHPRPTLINLGSSATQPWTLGEFRERAPSALEADFFSYPNVGRRLIPALRETLRLNGNTAALPTVGAAEAIALAMHALALTRRKQVALPVPCYGAFRGLARMFDLNIHPYAYPREAIWRPDLDEMQRLAAQCDALIVINPHNPTGQMIDRDTLGRCAETLSSRGGVLIVDEMLLPVGHSGSCVGLAANVLVIGGLSKIYGLPGLRLGWIVAADEHTRMLRAIQQYLTVSVTAHTAILGAAVLCALSRFDRSDVVARNRRILVDWIDSQAVVATITKPIEGTVAIVEVRCAIPEPAILEEMVKAGVLLTPGSCFGGGDGRAYFRLGYGGDSSQLRDGLKALGQVMANVARR